MAQQLFDTHHEKLNDFDEWIKTQKRLPQNIDKLLLLRFLNVYDFDLDRAKELLVINLEERAKHPHLFANRDVSSNEMLTAMKTLQVFPLPKNTDENHKVTIFRLADTNSANFTYIDIVRMIFVMMDVRFVSVDRNELINGEIGILDMSGFTFKHFLIIVQNMGLIRIYMNFVQECAAFKIIQNHFINCPSMIHRFLSLIKPFTKKELFDSMHFHTSLDTLYDFIPREILPDELGGDVGTMEIFYQDWMEIIQNKRNYVINDDNWSIQE